MIQISNLTKKYGETVVFSNLNYTFENTCIYGLVGRNGVGKTTLLNILSNYDKNYTGVISIDGEKMNKVDYLDMPVAYAMDDLRHSHASLLISKLGAQPNLVADRLGHEKIQTTLSTYSHLYPDQSRKLADQLEKLAEADEN